VKNDLACNDAVLIAAVKKFYRTGLSADIKPDVLNKFEYKVFNVLNSAYRS
jgi:hypothetical protein